jgi:hypothetical protein
MIWVVDLDRVCLQFEFFEMHDSVRRVTFFFLFFQRSGRPRPRSLRALVVSPPDVGIGTTRAVE